VTFGEAISTHRKKNSLSQKELAQQITKEDGEPISPQYLNDIEHDRRGPGSHHLIEQFAKKLKIEREFLYYLAGEIPNDLRKTEVDEKKAVAAFKAFRKTLH
jgi:transcriptional regulator with XRE-family HTH domain